jgi:uncharacterized protein (TIGR04222 family)
MKEPISQIWQKIQTFSLDNPAVEVPFSQKLAKEQKWTSSFTHRAIAEYKKFMLLCATCPNGASPSDTVDKVWHLHLTYTTNYWVDFCQNTLGKEIHHHPSHGGATENQKHQDWYEATLKHYITYFDQPPPADIWNYPPNFAFENHLSEQSLYKKVPVQTAEPHVLSQNAEYFLYAYLIVLVALIAFFGNPFMLSGSNFLAFYGLFAIATILPIVAESMDHQKALDKINFLLPNGLHAYHLAYLSGEKNRMLETAIIELADKGVLAFDEQNKKFIINRALATVELERNPLYHTVMALEGNETNGQTLSEIFETSAKHLSKSVNLSSLAFQPNQIVKQAQLIWSYVGAFRLIQGLAMGKPVLFLVLMMATYWILKYFIMENGSRHILSLVKEKYRNQSRENAYAYALDGNSVLTGIAILNVGLMFGALTPKKVDSDGSWVSSCGSDSSCSSDGGGDGGGGCGGCGGD